jgi:uncharacterized protein (UPF0276 family)
MNALAGIGLKDQHALPLLQGAAAVDFVEVHAENCLVAGGPRLRRLERLRERWPLSVHGVGLSIGGDAALDERHLDALDALLRRFEPRWFSEHLAWSSHGGAFLADLLPLPYDEMALARVVEHVDQVQTRLRRQMLLENPSSYLEFEASTMDEGSFIAEVVRRSGCGLLLDINNAYVSAVNHGRDPWELIDALPAQAIAEIHLAGFAEDCDAAGDRLLIDHHGSPVDQAVWQLYEGCIRRFGAVPTLIERDHDVPALPVLAAEAAQAKACMLAAAAWPVAA